MIAFITNVTICTDKTKESFEKNGEKIEYTTVGLRHDEFDNILHLVIPKKNVDLVDVEKGRVAKQVTLIIGEDKKAKVTNIEY